MSLDLLSIIVAKVALLKPRFRLALKVNNSSRNKDRRVADEDNFVLEHFEVIEIKVNVHIIMNVKVNNKVPKKIIDNIVVLMIVNHEISFRK